MLTALAILGVLAALFLAAALATRDGQALQPAPPDAADLALPSGPLVAQDVRGLRFGLAARGYRMSEVDEALDRLAGELDDRDRRIAELSGEPSGGAPVSLSEGETFAGGDRRPVADLATEPEPGTEPLADAAPLHGRSGSRPLPLEGDGFPQVQSADDPSADDPSGGGPPGGDLSAVDLSAGQAPYEPVDPPVRP